MEIADNLYEIRQLFYLSNFQQCVSECTVVSSADLAKQELYIRDYYLYRSYIALSQATLVVNELSGTYENLQVTDDCEAAALKAVYLLAKYISSADDTVAQSALLAQCSKLPQCEPTAIIQACMCLHVHEPREALRVLHTIEGLEALAYRLSIHASMHRCDLARADLARMKALDEECVLTQLCHVWLALATADSSTADMQECLHIVREVQERVASGASSCVHNTHALCLLRLGKREEAGQVLRRAYEQDMACGDTLLNLAAVCSRDGRDKESARYMVQARQLPQSQDFVQHVADKAVEIDQLIEQFSVAC